MNVGDLVKINMESSSFIKSAKYINVLRDRFNPNHIGKIGLVVGKNKIINYSSTKTNYEFIFKILWDDNSISSIHPTELVNVSDL